MPLNSNVRENVRILNFLIAMLAILIAYVFFNLAIQTINDYPRVRKVSQSNINDLSNLSLFIQDFKKTNNKTPNIEELNVWGKKQNNKIFDSFGESIVYYDPAIDPQIFGSGPDDGFTLCFWNDPFICVQSWRVDSNSGFIPDYQWFYFGSKVKDFISFFLLAIVFGLARLYNVKK